MLKLNPINKTFLPAIVIIAIVTISAAMHFKHFNKELMGMHVWRQTQTQSTIVNFCEEDMNILNPRRNDRGDGDGIFRMEFPLMQWLVAATCKLFGNHLIISRIWMFVIGLFSVFGMYKLLKTISGSEVPALIGAWAFNFSPSFYYYTINPMPDNLALCLGIWGLAFFAIWIKTRKMHHLLLSGIILCISALVKLPFILYFAVPFLYFLTEIRKKSGFQSSILLIAGLGIGLLPVVAWYLIAVPAWEGNGIVQGIFGNSISGDVLVANFMHHLFVNLPELLLNYGSVLFFLAAFYFIVRKKSYKKPLFLPFAALGLALILYLLFELNMVGKSHDYYLFPFLPLLFILVGYGAYQLFKLPAKAIGISVIVIMLILPVTAFLRIDKRWNPDKPGFNKDLLVYKDELRNAVPKDALCLAGSDLSHFIFFYYIDKKGWGFDYDHLESGHLRKMISEGAEYLYSDSRIVDENPGIVPFLDELILERGTVRVFRLKAD